MSLREVIEESFSSSEYYRVHYRRAGLIDEICFCCRDGEGGHLTLSMSRAAGKERYSENELDAARRISPIVTRLLVDSWRELVESDPASIDISTMDQHRLIENARVNFGRSILTRREYEILQFLLQGKSIAFISRVLSISINTTRVHRKNIYAKLNIRSGSEVFTLFLDVVSKTDYIADRDPLIEYQGAHAARGAKPSMWLAAQR
jgi:DNA-binding CsgD family transcriptional regulator